jgi:uncharacterized protein YndB with AHSA1/START domain
MDCLAGMQAADQIEVSRAFAAPPGAVFDAWLDVESAAQFLFATPGGMMEKIEIVPRVGGGFHIAERRGEMLATHFGTYLEIERPRRLAFSFGVDPNIPMTRVEIAIDADGDGAALTLKHEGVWLDYTERTRAGWVNILDNLARTLGVA